MGVLRGPVRPRFASEVPLSTFSADAIAGLAGPDWTGDAARRRPPSGFAGASAAQHRRGGVALQPHRRARPRRVHARRAVDRRTVEHGDLGRASRSCRGDDADGERARATCPSDGRRPRPGCTTRSPPTRSSSTCPPASRSPTRSSSATRARPTARPPRPQLVVRAGADSEVTRRRGVRGRRRRARSLPGHRASPSAGAARVGYVGVQQLDRAAWSIGTLDIEADAQASVTAGLAGFGGDYARLRTDCRLVGRGRHRRPAGRLLRRRRPDARLPHLPGPRRARHHQQPALQGRGERPLPVRLHRPHPGRQGRPGHQRLPDQPQHQALRRRVGRVGAQPRDREQRRALQPRLGRRPDRRGAALLPREPRRADPGRRAAHRGRVLRRGARPAARQRPARPRSTPRVAAKLDRRCSHERRRARRPARRPRPTARPAGSTSATTRIAVVRIGDDVYAIGDRCTPPGHLAVRGRGRLRRASTIECWKHGSAFSLETGEPESLPATRPVPVYEVASSTATTSRWWSRD